MTRARRELVSLESTSYYHVISRCVRRAFLWGEGSFIGKNYEHRKGWVIEQLQQLSGIFAIDICAYVVMSNHYHLVLQVDTEKAETWKPIQVIERWERLFSIPLLITHFLRGEITTRAEAKEAEKLIETWRERLVDIFWFMRSLNEHLARGPTKRTRRTGTPTTF